MSKRYVVLSGFAVVAIAAAPISAIAGHGKAGLWSVTTQMSGMPQMPQLTPEQMQQMQAMGVHMPHSNPHGVTSQYCMTEAEANSDSPPPSMQKQCKVSNLHVTGNTMNADMTCNGRMHGHGHMTMTYDNPEHYSGQVSFAGEVEGQPSNVTDSFDGHWVSADCGSVKPAGP
jgi:Protein of unknown function (DUF3617)